MDKKIALLLLTCDRPEKTQATVDSLLKYVDLSRFILLHGDDASQSNNNCKIAWRAGFKTVVRPPIRKGVSHMWQALIDKAAALGVEWVLMQENDWEWVKPFPAEIFDEAQAREDIYYIRLFGAFKEPNNTRPCSQRHGGKMKDVEWKEYKPGWEIGDAHWGFPANITRIGEARFLTKGIKREADCRDRSGKINKLTLRPVDNIVYHIGENRTPGFHA